MMRIRDIRSFAWRQLNGKRGTILIAYILLSIVGSTAISLIALPSVFLFKLYSRLLLSLPDNHLRILMPASGIVAALMLILLVLLFSGLGLGIQKLFLRIARGQAVKVSEVFSGFFAPAHWMRYTGVVLILAAVQFLLILPVELVSLAYGESSPNTSIIQTIMQLLSIVASLHLFPLTYISADHPEYSPWDCLSMSFHLMRKRKWKLFLLWLSFSPLIFVLIMVPILVFGACYMTGMYSIAFSMLFMLALSAMAIFLILILPHLLTSECTFYLYMYREDYGEISYADTPSFFQSRHPSHAWQQGIGSIPIPPQGGGTGQGAWNPLGNGNPAPPKNPWPGQPQTPPQDRPQGYPQGYPYPFPQGEGQNADQGQSTLPPFLRKTPPQAPGSPGFPNNAAGSPRNGNMDGNMNGNIVQLPEQKPFLENPPLQNPEQDRTGGWQENTAMPQGETLAKPEQDSSSANEAPFKPMEQFANIPFTYINNEGMEKPRETGAERQADTQESIAATPLESGDAAKNSSIAPPESSTTAAQESSRIALPESSNMAASEASDDAPQDPETSASGSWPFAMARSGGQAMTQENISASISENNDAAAEELETSASGLHLPETMENGGQASGDPAAEPAIETPANGTLPPQAFSKGSLAEEAAAIEPAKVTLAKGVPSTESLVQEAQGYAGYTSPYVPQEESGQAAKPQDNVFPEEKGGIAATMQEAMPSPVAGREEPLSYKTEEDGWDSYLRWKRDRGIGMDNAEQIPATEKLAEPDSVVESPSIPEPVADPETATAVTKNAADLEPATLATEPDSVAESPANPEFAVSATEKPSMPEPVADPDPAAAPMPSNDEENL